MTENFYKLNFGKTRKIIFQKFGIVVVRSVYDFKVLDFFIDETSHSNSVFLLEQKRELLTFFVFMLMIIKENDK